MVKLICECGVNFSNLNEAKIMIRESKELNLFATKFQIYNNEIIKDSKDYEFLKSIMLDYDSANELYKYGKSINQEVFFSVMYPEAIDICERIGVRYYKIRFKDNKNWEIINKICETKKQFFISVIFPITFEFTQTINLYCNPKYPSKITEYLYDGFNYKEHGFQGISDHTPCTCLFECLKDDNYDGFFEKHIKLDNTTPLEDKWSVSFSELKEVLKP